MYFHKVKSPTSAFSNYLNHIDPETAEMWLQSFLVGRMLQTKHYWFIGCAANPLLAFSVNKPLARNSVFSKHSCHEPVDVHAQALTCRFEECGLAPADASEDDEYDWERECERDDERGERW